MLGKLPPDVLRAAVLSRTGASDEAVVQGPAYGEDSAAVRHGDELLVISADPLSLATEQVGTLAVHVACNDVAASGAQPRWLTNTMFLPDENRTTVEDITSQIDTATKSIGVSVVGGHAEYYPELSQPLLSMGVIGTTDRFVSTGGATPGDRVVIAGTAGIEGTAILANDFREELREAGISVDMIETASEFIEDISVIDRAQAATQFASGMHDPTEGGILAGLVEMAKASGSTFSIAGDAIPVHEVTERCTRVMDVDPLAMFGSGALLITVSSDDVDGLLTRLEGTGPVAVIGTVEPGDSVVELDGTEYRNAPRDSLYPLLS